MDINLERDGGVIGTLFQQIINDMKNTSPLWEDFMAKANKLHVCLRATIQAISAYLDAFQKIADAATNSRGASKEIGTALTRVCLRHKAVETRMKSFTTAIMDCLILPLQDKVEDWKRQVAVIDKEHAKEYKRCRAELKKRSTDTLRLQKKAKKGQSDSIQSLVESSMHDITQRKADLEEVERRSLRAAMIEERTRFCTFVNLLQPVVKEEFEVMYELGHLQEAMETITNVTKNPNILPQASEELILETKTSASFLYPESPGSHGYSNSLGSRKSSVCSISSINSSGSSNSPGMPYQRSLSQLMTPAIRLKPGESSDSGFCSSPALTTQASTTTNQTHAVSTWPPHSQDPVTSLDRPHTISTAYEKGHQRPPLTVYTFQNPDGSTTTTEQQHPVQKSPANVACRPPLPVRCSSLERPLSSTAGARNQTMHNMRQSPSPLPAHITKEYPIIQPTYVNMSELATMAALKITNSINQHYQQQNQEPLTPIQSHTPNMPFSAQSPQSDSSSVTTTYNNLTTTTNTNTNNTNTTNSMTTNPESPLSTATDDTLSRQASVDAAPSSLNDYDDYVVHDNQTLSSSTSEKLSLFEKLEQRQASTAAAAAAAAAAVALAKTNSITSNAGNNETQSIMRRNDDLNKSIRSIDKDPGQMYEDSIQELNNLIGELDSFQREHEQKMKQKQREKQQQQQQHQKQSKSLANVHDVHNTTADTTLTASSIGDASDIYNNFDKLSIGSSDPNPLMCSTTTHSSDMTFGSDTGDLTDCQATTMSLKLNLSTTEHPLIMHSSTNSINGGMNGTSMTSTTSSSNGSTVARHIELIPDGYNVSDDYVKENTEIVVLRRKDSQTDLNNCGQEQMSPVVSGNGKDVERISSFRCSSFGKTESASPNDGKSTLKRGLSITSADSIAMNNRNRNEYNSNGMAVMIHDQDVVDHADIDNNDSATITQMIRQKPIIASRPASLSGCVNRNTTRRTANSVKPPPPVRRSSSVTPSHQLDVSHSSLQPNVMNASSESLPPPPAYLLDSTGRTSPGKVGETVKALTELNHMPASPSVLRRNISQISPAAPQTIYSTSNQQQSPTPSQQQHNPFYGSSPQSDYYSTTNQTKQSQSIYSTLQPSHSSHNSSSEQSPSSLPIYLSTRQIQSGIYAQPKHLTKVSSFRNASPNSARNQPGTRVITQLNTSRTNDLHQQIAPPTAQAKTTPSSHPHSNQKIYAQSSYHHTMQSPSPHNSDHTYQQNHEAKAPKTKPERIYTSASDRNYHYHYQQQQQQHHHHHQPQQQQQQHHQQQQQNNQHSVHGMAMSNDGPYSNHHHQQQQQSPYHRHYNVQQKIYVSTNPFIHTTTSHYSPSYSPTSFGKESGPVYATSPPTSTTNYSSPNYETTNNSIRAKSKLGFLENLNAKLAEQRLSGKAFAVRNIINSKALKRVEGGRSQIPVANSNNYANCDEPDPRVCHESLMDQIKRGATLKRNKSINDRSAPKIY
ncbi:DEP domain-containing protein DDB_G0279099 isoform X3 [Contarinia nasturtii]|uniref:DEP domain-containing protein DDB_G0279099 isoform X3 n=1 Tax=Contarinia nasturtii TaxID=265458 RepID=UPI0012D47D34|nr:DEP domain-containing protein DDB_G0279099 isoform X3 [Contarinia nasturtii]